MNRTQLIFCFLLFCNITLWTQRSELAIQRGHSNTIRLVSYSPSGELLASFGDDKQLVIWDVRKGKEIKSISLGQDNIDQIAFSADNQGVFIRHTGTYSYYNIGRSGFETWPSVEVIARNRMHYIASDNLFEVVIKNAKLYKKKPNEKKKIFQKSAEYFDEYFTAVDVSVANNLIIAGNDDGKVYLFKLSNGAKVPDATGTKRRTLTGHLSNITDLCFSPDQNYFATASADRSIIIWNTKTLRIERRLYTQSFRNYALAFSDDGNKLAVGNEIGQVKLIDLASTNIALINYPLHIHPVSKIQFDGNDKIMTSGYDNTLRITDLKTGESSFDLHYLKGLTIPNLINGFFEKGLRYYRNPYSIIKTFDHSKHGQYLAYSGVTKSRDYPILRVVDLHSKKEKRVVKQVKQIQSIRFVSDSTFISCDGSDSICYWTLLRNKIIFNTIVLPIEVTDVEIIDARYLLLRNGNSFSVYDGLNKVIIAQLPILSTCYTFDRERGQLLFADVNYLIHLFDLREHSFHETKVFRGHSDEVRCISFHPSKNVFASTGFDASIKLWDLATGELLVSIVPIGKDDRIVLTEENKYLISKKNLNSVGFKVGTSFFLAEQFDMEYNRPDLVLERLGFTEQKTLDIYKNAYVKRWKRMSYSESDTLLAVPKISLLNADRIPLVTKEDKVTIKIKATDDRLRLKRLLVEVNSIPIYGTQGVDLTASQSHAWDTLLEIKLSPGMNKISVSCINEQGIQSYRESFETEFIGSVAKSKMYFIGLGVTHYQDTNFNLKYAAKDIFDLASGIKKLYPEAKIILLTDSEATRENILKLKEQLMLTGINDKVIISLSGHGILGDKLDFYYATHDIDFRHPEIRGLLYDDLESLFDGIPARNKLLLVDACHSGEIDKTLDLKVDEKSGTTAVANGKVSVPRGAELLVDSNSIGMQNSFELMKEVFADISHGNGAVVISAAGGLEYALESNRWNNGVFTYAVLQALQGRKADLNKDHKTTISELKNYVSEQVQRLTGGRQTPTSRRENFDSDWILW
ncbi:MAG: hypothetical protein NTW54_09305 [Bacteroidetes bacterium]|nr:hypothetical protein [Bacteroidota bacterium]